MQFQKDKNNTKDNNVSQLLFRFFYFSDLTIKIVFRYKNQPLSSLNFDALKCKSNAAIFSIKRGGGKGKLLARLKMLNGILSQCTIFLYPLKLYI